MCVNCDRKYLSARILHYAANKIWILTTMASFISKSPGDNHISCFPLYSQLRAQSQAAPGTAGDEPEHPWGRGDLSWIPWE